MAPRKPAAAPVEGQETGAAPKPRAPRAPRAAAPATTEGGYQWAVNAAKLTRAKVWVNGNQPSLKGAELEAAVKARYVALGGLVRGEKTGAVAPAQEVNMADNDEDEGGDAPANEDAE